MTKNDLKSGLAHIQNVLKEVEERARKLENQNLADIAAQAHRRVGQLLEHPDADKIADKDEHEAPATKDEAIARMRDDGDADPEGTAAMNWPHLFGLPPHSTEQQPANPFPGHAKPHPEQDY